MEGKLKARFPDYARRTTKLRLHTRLPVVPEGTTGSLECSRPWRALLRSSWTTAFQFLFFINDGIPASYYTHTGRT